ncbi:aromatic ring-opening dioxygenase LigA [Streptomyces rimosus subsp. pseudoverticillatus]|uniref:NAD(P)-binding domain-containing protein n=1 Tax=Streptomyces rimosus TaxID=1927 RepID=UPI0006B2A81A|nr:NAD(P)-binding domain-containing protein [Streptomyces rimosus]KOT74355.1 aromatic ring-opening dioxygenase LigA [Streptomyces rimosus subsp. pseudoverticillatus]
MVNRAKDTAVTERIGFIGVGEIARAMVEGLCEGNEAPPEIFLSPRGADTAAELADRYPTVRVCSGNQDVIDRAGLIVIAVRPDQRAEALPGLTVPADRVVVSVLAGVAIDEVRRTLGTKAPVVRAIPLPAVRSRTSVTVICPDHPAAAALFAALGGALPLADEASFNVFSALTGTITSHYQYLATLTEWAAGHGVPAEAADQYLRSLFQDVGRSLGDGSRPLPRLVADHETPNGSNERIRTTWFDEKNAGALREALDGLLAHLEGSRAEDVGQS